MKDLFNEQINTFSASYKLLKAKKGEILRKPTAQVDSLLFLKSGFLRQFIVTKTGQEITVNIIDPQNPIYFSQFFAETKNRYFYQTFSPIEYYKIPLSEFSAFLEKNPEVFKILTKQYILKSDELFTSIEMILSGDAYTKVVSVFYLIAERYGRETENGEVRVGLQLTHREISELIGLTRETVSLQIIKLEKEGLIRRNGKNIVIPDMKKLAEISSITTAE